LTVKTRNIDYTQEYILPITIKSVSGNIPVSDDYKTAYFVFEADVDAEAGRENWVKFGASSEWDAPYVVSKAFDGDLNTYWHSALTGMPQWFAVDMTRYKKIDGFTYNNRKDVDQKSLPKHVVIETSYDGSVWTTALDIAELPQSRVLQVFPLESTVIARYFRFTVLSTWTGDPYTYVAEISIYSGEAPEAEEDMEIHTWTVDSYSSQWNDGSLAAFLIDGNKESLWHSEPFDAALNGMPQWVIFDMKKSRKITGIKIWHRQNDHGMEPKHIIFEVSDDKSTWTTLIDEPELSNEWTVQQVLVAPAKKSGRYLRMTVVSNWGDLAWTALGEVTPY